MEILEGPTIVTKPATAYVGIRVVTPFRGMLATRDELMRELVGWLDERPVADQGPLFLRLHVIDMNGPMDIEVGLITRDVLEGDGRVRAGALPGGRYATLTYVNHARRANGTLLDWANESGIKLDKWDGPTGDHFACRYEAYLTDPRTEPRKTKWQVALNIRIADET
jgi:effector-binding domain-containing protein